MFDSRDYEWADITLMLGGRDMTGIRGVKFSEKAEREAYHGKGRHAQSIQTGNVTVDGELILKQSDVLAMKKSSRTGSLLALSLDAIVNFGDPSEGNAMETYSITGIRFLEDTKDIKQGDKYMEITLPFIALRAQLK